MINSTINIDQLLVDTTIVYTPISNKYFKVVLLQSLLLTLFLLSIPTILFVTKALELPYFLGIVIGCVLLVILRLLLIKWSFKYRGYSIRQCDILCRKGIINIEETIVPYNRVQHVKIKKGLWSKIFGLSELMLFTAAGNNYNLVIAGIEDEVAEHIKSFIINRVNSEESLIVNPISDGEVGHLEDLPVSEPGHDNLEPNDGGTVHGN